LNRKPLLDLLDRYAARHRDEAACVARFRAFVASRPDCFARTCQPGHVTASAWVFSSDRRRFLLGHHRKLDRWLQLGGHADGEADVARVALREAREESGLDALVFLGPDGEPGEPFVLDVDVHEIPARPGEPAHAHHDVRFVLVAPEGAEPRASHESHALAWFGIDELDVLAARGADESLLRLGRKAQALAARG
jgi:8-oxo-dGTP pyrophosphatase MutT (NUDIX family)